MQVRLPFCCKKKLANFFKGEKTAKELRTIYFFGKRPEAIALRELYYFSCTEDSTESFYSAKQSVMPKLFCVLYEHSTTKSIN